MSVSDTICKKCCFAEYNGDTQVGCKAGMLSALENDGAEILECFDEEKEFYVIRNRQCLYQRHHTWKRHDERIVDAIKRARKEIEIKYHVIIRANNSTNDCFKTLKNLLSQTLKPYKITILRQPENTIDSLQIINYLYTVKDVKWTIRNLSKNMSWDKAKDLALKNDDSHYFCVVNSGYTLPKGTFKNIDEKITDEFLKFSMLTPDDNGNGLFMMNNVYNYWKVFGDPVKTIEQNIKENECHNEKKTYMPMSNFHRSE